MAGSLRHPLLKIAPVFLNSTKQSGLLNTVAVASLAVQKQQLSTSAWRGTEALSPVADPRLYDEAHRRAREEPAEFWAEAAQGVHWFKQWDRVLDDSNSPFTKWFSGGQLNVCYNAVDRHVAAGHGEQTAIIYDSPMTATVQKISYQQLLTEVSKLAGVLTKHGVQKGDRVLIYMPMIPQAIQVMLACARIGAVHSLVFGGFASKELATRINHAEPKIVFSANCGIEPGKVIEYKPLLDKAIEMSKHKPSKCIIFNRKFGVGKDLQDSTMYGRDFEMFNDATLVPGRDLDYAEEVSTAQPHDCVPVEAMEPLYLLYTSGTTGIPKAVVRPSGGHTVVLNWSMWNLYGMKPQETWLAASDLGWVVGHSYICYAPLIHGNTTVLFEGKPVNTPDAGTYFRMLQEHNIAAMFVAPTALRAVNREDPHAHASTKYSHPNFRYLFVAGEHCDHETSTWAHRAFRAPVLDNWWQTETGSAITATCVGLGNTLQPPSGVTGRPVPGWNIQVLNEHGEECKAMELGSIVAKLPLPPGNFSTLYKSDVSFKELYFTKYPGYYDSMDGGFRDEHGNIAVMTRVDDVINVAGKRLSSGQLEEAVSDHDDIVEAAVVAKPDKLKGHVPVGLCVLKSGVDHKKEEIKQEVVQLVRTNVGALASFKEVHIVKKLPKTRSGKTARNTLAAMIAGQEYKIPITIEDASVYLNIREVLTAAGYEVQAPSE